MSTEMGTRGGSGSDFLLLFLCVSGSIEVSSIRVGATRGGDTMSTVPVLLCLGQDRGVGGKQAGLDRGMS